MSVAPGWYDDGVTPAIERWYDGAAWTEHTRAMRAGATTSGTAPPTPTGADAPMPVPVWPATRAWPATTAWPTTTAWPVTQTRGSVSTVAASAAAEAPRAAARGAQPAGGPVARLPYDDADPFGKDASSEKYPEGWGPSGYEIGPERRRGRTRAKAEPATDWLPQPTGAPASADAPPPETPGPWPLPGQPLVPARRPGAKPSDPMHWLIPVGRPWQSIVAGYLGLVGLVIWPLAPFAVWLGFWGRGLARAGGNGGGRATFAIVTGLVGTFVGVLVLMAALRG